MKSLFLLVVGGGNPANMLAAEDPFEKCSNGRLRVAEAILQRIIFTSSPSQEEEEVTALERWAAIEEVNELVGGGSRQRVECPFKLPGSGRWLARDRGGCFRLLREAVITRSRLGTGQIEALERGFDLYSDFQWRRMLHAAAEKRGWEVRKGPPLFLNSEILSAPGSS